MRHGICYRKKEGRWGIYYNFMKYGRLYQKSSLTGSPWLTSYWIDLEDQKKRSYRDASSTHELLSEKDI